MRLVSNFRGSRFSGAMSRIISGLTNTNSTGGDSLNCAGSLLAYAANTIRYGCLDDKRAILVEAGVTNRLKSSEALDGADWVKTANGAGTAPIVLSTTGADPSGGNKAVLFQFETGGSTNSDESAVRNQASFAFDGNGVGSVWLWTPSGVAIARLRIDYDGGSILKNVTITTTPRRYFIFSGTTSRTSIRYFQVKLRGNSGTSTSAQIYVWGAQAEQTTDVDLETRQVWLEGDSFVAGASADGIAHSLSAIVKQRLNSSTSTAVGGSTMTDIVNRVINNAATYSGYDLFVWDGSANGFTDIPTLMGHLATIDSTHTGDWYYIPPITDSTESVITAEMSREIRDAAIAAGYNVIDPWPVIWRLSDGSVTDEDAVAAGLVPPSLFLDTVHLTAYALFEFADIIEPQAIKYATSYIKTMGAAQERSSDLVSGALIDNLTGGARVRSLARMETAAGSTDVVFQLDDGSNDNRIVMYWDSSAEQYVFELFSGGVSQGAASYAADLGEMLDVDMTFTSAAISGTVNGGAVFAPLSGGYSEPDVARIGCDAADGGVPARMLCSKFLVDGVPV
ncbi:phage head spike fiber domain-containing protein [Celeribacter sp.]|uniref:phage head spike fiber domain-containing protein n=1 Tax=Celeribacter sp. TaxID=1890673 RepID=UPI003A920FF9